MLRVTGKPHQRRSSLKIVNGTNLTEPVQYTYAYDDIGNRIGSGEGGTEDPTVPLRMTGYTVNLLNQLTNRVNPSAVEVLGAANAQAEVRVNGLPAYRRGEYFRRELAVTNASGPAWTPVSVSAMQSGTTNTTIGSLLSPPVNEVRTNNADGNLLMDGLWIYQWDAENRLLSVTSTNTLPASARRQVRWEYDAAGRRVRETLGAWSTSQLAYTNVLDLKLIYDGWACIAELTPANGLLRQYVWGTDLSGSMTGAGGVGGLLWMKQGATAHFAAMDGNGNVMDLVDGALGDFSARYEYDTFGQTIRLTGTGTIAQDNRYRFSTKRAEPTTGMILYEYRVYDAKAGRWLNRDPIAERGGLNLYGMVGNNPICRYDVGGLYGKGDHHTLTTMALSSVSGWLGTTPKCISRIQKILLDANDSQDGWGVGGNLWDNYRHYNRDTTQTGVAGDTAYGNYLASEQSEFASNLQNPTKANCKAALQALGRLSHSWQDFFIHAIRRDGLGGKENSSFPGWTAWSVGVTGNPSSRGNFFPSSYSLTGGGEHPPTDEPVLPSSAEWRPRFDGALTYTTQEFMTTLFQWINGCRCTCEQSWWY